MAQAELHMRGFFSHPPLVGAAGRIVGDTGIQGSHPGPSLWVAMLPVYILGGRTSGALMAAVVSVHLAAVVGALWLAKRRGDWALAVPVGVVALLVIRSSGPDFMIEPWNPWLAVLPFMVFVLLVLDVVAPVIPDTRRRVIALVAATVVGSHCVQCHAGYLVLVAGALTLAVVIFVRELGWRVRPVRRGLAVATLLGLVVWLPPIIDQLRREPGNASLLWQHFGSPSEPTIGLRAMVRIVAEQFNVVGPWITGPGRLAPSAGWFRYPGLVVMVSMGVWAAFVAHRRGSVWLVRSFVVVVAFVGVGAVSVYRIFGPFFEYTIRWFWVLSALWIALVAHTLIASFGRSLVSTRFGDRRPRSTLGVAALVGLLVLGGVASAQAVSRSHLPGPTDSRITGGLSGQLTSALDHHLRYLVRFWDPYTLNATGFGVVLELERHGFRVGVDPQFAAAALPHRTMGESQSDKVLWVVVGPYIDKVRADSTLDEVAFVDPRSSAEAARADRMIEEVGRMLVAAGREDLVPSLTQPGATLLFPDPPLPEEIAVKVRDIVLLGQPVAVFVGEPGVEHPSLS